MCGIIGYSGIESAMPKIVHGLSSLEYRGYDSAGVAFFESGALKTVKSKGRIENLKEKLGDLCESHGICCGIGHTRWATHGEPSDRNSHPHGTERVYIVHNGIIENYAQIKELLSEKGYAFETETDTEAAAKLLDFFYGDVKDPIAAIRETGKMLRGSYAICAVFRDCENRIYAFRKDNPLLVAPSKGGNFLASDVSAVLSYTKSFRRLEEGEIALVEPERIEIMSATGELIPADFETVEWDVTAAEKEGFPHFMLKEIHEEPKVIEKTVGLMMRDGLPEFGEEAASDKDFAGCERIHIVACGTAYHAGLVGKYAIEKLARVSVSVELASEFRYRNPILGKNDLVLVISQSGETADTLAALRLAKERKIRTLGIVNVMGSAIAREADSVIYTHAGPEIAVASTKAYSVQLSVLYLLAVKLGLLKGQLDEKEAAEYVRILHEDVPKAVEKALEKKDSCALVTEKYKDCRSIFFIGRGPDFALSCEAALKMKEISYIHCESYAAGEMKHGTISLVTDGVPVFAFVTQESILEKMLSNIKEVSARGARVVAFCCEGGGFPSGLAEDVIEVPCIHEFFAPIVAAASAQLAAYFMSCHLGLDVDKPRNLAKSVTVE